MSAHPSASDKTGMENLMAQRKAAYLLTLEEGAREAEGTVIDGLDVLQQLERIGLSIGYRAPGVADGAQVRQEGQFLPQPRGPADRSARESTSSSTRGTEDRTADQEKKNGKGDTDT